MKEIAPLDLEGVETLSPLEMNAIHFSIGMHTDLPAAAGSAKADAVPAAPASGAAATTPSSGATAPAPRRKSLKDL